MLDFLETIGEEDLVIFLNSRDDFCFYDEGQKALQSGETIDLNYLDRYESFRQR